VLRDQQLAKQRVKLVDLPVLVGFCSIITWTIWGWWFWPFKKWWIALWNGLQNHENAK